MDKGTKIIWTLTLIGLMLIFSAVAYVDWKNYEEKVWFSGKVITNELVEDGIDYLVVTFDNNRTYNIVLDDGHHFRVGDNFSRVILYREPNGEHPSLWYPFATFHAPLNFSAIVDLTEPSWDNIINRTKNSTKW